MAKKPMKMDKKAAAKGGKKMPPWMDKAKADKKKK